MRKKNLTGISVISSFLILIVLAFLINSQGEMVKAVYVKLAIIILAALISSAGIFLIDVFRKDSAPALKKLTWISGITLIIFTFLVSFNVVPILSGWNWLISFAILFVLLIQIQLLNWGQRVHQVVRFSTLFVILSDLFLVIFFVAKWKSYELELWINLSAVFSIVFTSIGLFFLREKKDVDQRG